MRLERFDRWTFACLGQIVQFETCRVDLLGFCGFGAADIAEGIRQFCLILSEIFVQLLAHLVTLGFILSRNLSHIVEVIGYDFARG